MNEKHHQPNPSRIIETGMGFFAAKTLLTAINMGLFTHLASAELTGMAIKEKLGLHERNLYDFLDALVALGFLERTGLKETAKYKNTAETEIFLDKNKPSYVGGMLEMANNRLYPFWHTLEDGLKTGLPQNETKHGGKPVFEELYSSKEKTRAFLAAMGGIQMGNFMVFASAFDFSKYKTFCDIGGAGGYLAAQVALNNKHMNCMTYDLPPVAPIAIENLSAMGVAEQVKVVSGDFFADEIPKADVIGMGNILHDWGIKEKKYLIKKAYNALPNGGALAVLENIIDDDRRENVFGLLMSLNMLIETTEGYDFSMRDFKEWATEAGFREFHKMPLAGPSSAIVAIK